MSLLCKGQHAGDAAVACLGQHRHHRGNGGGRQGVGGAEVCGLRHLAPRVVHGLPGGRRGGSVEFRPESPHCRRQCCRITGDGQRCLPRAPG
eukprot:854681-Lingulodinium_polyedra.AAC.1